MTKKFVLVIDDADREACPDRPWTATLVGAGVPAGLGATPEDALKGLLADEFWAETEEESHPVSKTETLDAEERLLCPNKEN